MRSLFLLLAALALFGLEALTLVQLWWIQSGYDTSFHGYIVLLMVLLCYISVWFAHSEESFLAEGVLIALLLVMTFFASNLGIKVVWFAMACALAATISGCIQARRRQRLSRI